MKPSPGILARGKLAHVAGGREGDVYKCDWGGGARKESLEGVDLCLYPFWIGDFSHAYWMYRDDWQDVKTGVTSQPST